MFKNNTGRYQDDFDRDPAARSVLEILFCYPVYMLSGVSHCSFFLESQDAVLRSLDFPVTRFFPASKSIPAPKSVRGFSLTMVWELLSGRRLRLAMMF